MDRTRAARRQLRCSDTKVIWRAVGEYLGKATNQQAEIAAAAVGLESLKQPCQVSVFTDSKYVVETMNGRFRRKANLPWWERLDRAASAHKVHWEWTRGHAGTCCRKPPTTPRAASPPPDTSMNRSCAMPKTSRHVEAADLPDNQIAIETTDLGSLRALIL